MINFVKNVYNSPDLHGEFLLVPLKSYHAFSAEKMHSGSLLAKSALVVAGVFAYSILGVVAAVGMLVKLTGIPLVLSRNKAKIQEVRDYIREVRDYIRIAPGTDPILVSFPHRSRLQMDQSFSFLMSNARTERPRIIRAIKQYNEKFREVYCEASVRQLAGNFTTLQVTINLHSIV